MFTHTLHSTAKLALAGLSLTALFVTGVAANAQTQNIVEIASDTADLSTLVQAVTAAELAGTLSGTDEYTVLAPTNDAFDALPAGVLDNLLLPENQQVLTDILTYHVLEGSVDSTAVSAAAGTEVSTLNGDTISVTEMDGNLMVDDATVVTPDIDATNGIVHVIDQVLVPAGVDVSALATSTDTEEDDEDMDSEDATMTMENTVRSGGYSAPDYTGIYTLVTATLLVGSGVALRFSKNR